ELESTSAVPRSNSDPGRLEGDGSVIVLGRDGMAALELSQHPERLSKLIRRGSLFTVPRGTAIKLLQGNRFVIKIRIMEGPMVGQEGWAGQAQLFSSTGRISSFPSLPVQEGGSELKSVPQTTELLANATVSRAPTPTIAETRAEPDSIPA